MNRLNAFVRKLHQKLPVLLIDVLSIPVAWVLAYWLRYNLTAFDLSIKPVTFYMAMLILMIVQTACYYYFKVYRGLWRYTSLGDIVRILKAVLSAAVLVIPIYYEASILTTVPRSVLPLYCLMLITLLCSARLLRRFHWDRLFKRSDSTACERVVIIGAGRAGASLVRDLLQSNEYLLVGLLDDNPAKVGLEVYGVQVLGKIDLIQSLAITHRIDLIFIAIPSATSATMRRIVSQCDVCRIPYRTLPGLQALASGRVEVNALRSVRIEDLLGRDQVELYWEKIAKGIYDKRILVTGGGGSIGAELCRQLMRFEPAQLMVVDISEYNLYAIDLELRRLFPSILVKLALINVNDAVAMDEVFSTFKPEIVFHAAAYKHVPMLEHQVRTAVCNNVLGTRVVCEASVRHHVEKFVLISTDKAVNPTNVMGATKRIAEIYCQNLNERVTTQFITVRFGNVLDSVGSVVPLFKQQIQKGGPVTVTHPDMQRYFMTIPEACQLILQAMASGTGGEIYVLDMGEPVNISYLAEQMIRLSGKEPGKDIQIQYIGLRPGEKLYEELFHDSEKLVKTDHEKLFKARFREMHWEDLMHIMDALNVASVTHHDETLLALLQKLVPEFRADRLRIAQEEHSVLPV